jgi:hypothetical protein
MQTRIQIDQKFHPNFSPKLQTSLQASLHHPKRDFKGRHKAKSIHDESQNYQGHEEKREMCE